MVMMMISVMKQWWNLDLLIVEENINVIFLNTQKKMWPAIPFRRKMNEADKERYFREKEAYERITGHVLPVAKVIREYL